MIGAISSVGRTVLDTIARAGHATRLFLRLLLEFFPLLRRPRHKASLDAAWQADDALLLDASVLYVGPRDDIGRESFARERLGGYATVNLAATWQVIPEFALFGRVENLFDERYQDPVGFQRPGFGAWAGLKASL